MQHGVSEFGNGQKSWKTLSGKIRQTKLLGPVWTPQMGTWVVQQTDLEIPVASIPREMDN
jgi:hypothetical protein